MPRYPRESRIGLQGLGKLIDNSLVFTETVSATATANTQTTVNFPANADLSGLSNDDIFVFATLTVDATGDMANGPVYLAQSFIDGASDNRLECVVDNLDGSNDIDITIHALFITPAA